MKRRIQYLCVSHRGNYRNNNEDNFLYNGHCLPVNNPELLEVRSGVQTGMREFFGVFDGMGGEECGEAAAYIAAREAAAMYGEDGSRRLVSGPDAGIGAYCRKANAEICRFSRDNHLYSMGTTAAVAVFERKNIVLGNVGDSRIYRYSEGRLTMLSKDDVSDVPGSGKKPLSQNLGIPEEEGIVRPHIVRRSYRDGDIYLLCTDGLTDSLSDGEITRILSTSRSLQEAGAVLLKTALNCGGRDNITLVLCMTEVTGSAAGEWLGAISGYVHRIGENLTEKLKSFAG